MNEYKIYSMKLSFKCIKFESQQTSPYYSIKVTQNSQEKSINHLEIDSQGNISVNQIVQFQIEGESFRRETQCIVLLMRKGGKNGQQEQARFQFYVMDYKNYSKNEFKMQSKKSGQITLHMSINISSIQKQKKVNSSLQVSQLVPNKLQKQGDMQMTKSEGTSSGLRKTVKFMDEQMPKQTNKKQKTQQNNIFMLSIGQQGSNTEEMELMSNMSVVVMKQNEKDEGRTGKLKKGKLRKKQSLYCQQIQSNINNIRDVDIGDRLATASSSIKEEDNFFQALNRMKNKFELIQHNQQLLNEDDQYQQTHHQSSKKTFRIVQQVNFKYINEGHERSQTNPRKLPASKRYQLVKPSPMSVFVQEQNNDFMLNLSYVNKQIEDQQLKKLSYIKLSKISQLKKAANLSKDNNRGLIKANEQLMIAMQQMRQKYELSRKIINDKQTMMKGDFVEIKKNMQRIIHELALKNQESLLRDQKVKGLQQTIERQVREINQLKEQVKASHSKIKQLKGLLATKEDDSKNKTEQNYQKIFNSRQFKLDLQQYKISQEDVFNPFSLLLSSQRKQKTERETKHLYVKNPSQSSQEQSQRCNKSVEGAPNKLFRKFSRKKMSSSNIGESQVMSSRSKHDNMFERISQILLGDQNRLLKNL